MPIPKTEGLTRRSRRQLTVHLLGVGLYLLALLFVGVVVVQDLQGPLVGSEDTEHWEYLGYYLSEHLRFTPLPTLELDGNQTFYPYGVNAVFQPWGLERDYLYALFFQLFGRGPYLQLYFLVSLAITAFGTFGLLRRDFGLKRAYAAGFLIAFFNVYLIHKFPHHLSIATVHWTALNLVADFLLFRRLLRYKPLGLPFLFLRALLLVLALGQDIGYIASFAILSFVVTVGCVGGLLLYRAIRHKERLMAYLRLTFSGFRQAWRRQRGVLRLLGGTFLLVTFLLLPPILQIVQASTREPVASFATQGASETVSSGLGWAHPLRLFMPLLPRFHPFTQPIAWGDVVESPLDGSPGLSLTLGALLGLFYARRRLGQHLPLLLTFALCLLFHPELPTLQAFPWFRFYRIGGRATVIYPVVMVLLMLTLPLQRIYRQPRTGTRPQARRPMRYVFGLLGILLFSEFFMLYALTPESQEVRMQLEPTFLPYMARVAATPGEAVLDWPFCAIAATLPPDLCPHYVQNSSIYALRRFHNKKVMGQYFARLRPEWLAPYERAGWDRLLMGSVSRCFVEPEWDFFARFFYANDFAGINLYPDLLQPGCAEAFYARFGEPVAETVTQAGRVVFLPKPEARYSEVDPALGLALRFAPPLALEEADLLATAFPYSLAFGGLASAPDGNGSPVRWGYGPHSSLRFQLEEAQPLTLHFRFFNPLPEQRLELTLNGERLALWEGLQLEQLVERQLQFQGQPGENHLRLSYAHWNYSSPERIIAPEDSRPLAALYSILRLCRGICDIESLQVYPFGRTVLHSDNSLLRFEGFHNPEPIWRWSGGQEAALHFLSAAPHAARYRLELDATTLGSQRVTVSLNEQPLGELPFDAELEAQPLSFDSHLLVPGVNTLRFHLPDAHSSAADARVLGLAVRSFRLSESD